MDPVAAVVLLLAAAATASLAVLTAVGQRRRGGRLPAALLAGLFFPLAWIGWYAHDELGGS